MAISAQQVKELRDKTGAPMMDCKKALVDTDGDEQKAIDLLRKKGQASAEKRSGRATEEGRVGSYVHGGKIGVLVELCCETDFVAKNYLFEELMTDLCMQVAAMKPMALSAEDVADDVIEREREIYREQAKDKPPQAIDKIIEGKLGKFFKDHCLLEQPFIREPKKSVQDRITEVIAKTGENIRVRRFVRFEMGEE
jgi:elongation factor Ts